MALKRPQRLAASTPRGERLTPEHLSEVGQFYSEAYPGNWFEPRMLHSGQYFGIREEGKLVSVAGVHVYAPSQGVAGLGNIATHPDYRGRGLGTAVTARLCESLLESVETVGLNVVAHNQAAISCYEKLGFVPHAHYEEFQCSAL